MSEHHDPGAVAAAGAFQIDQHGEISAAHFHMQWQGVSTEQVARVLAQVGAKRRALNSARADGAADSSEPAQVQKRLWAQIDALYDQTVRQAARSPALAEHCLKLLQQARLHSLNASNAAGPVSAQHYLEQVRVKLARADGTGGRSEKMQIAGILAWTLLAVAVCLPPAALPWLLPDGSAGTLPVPQALILLLSACAWGALGGAVSTFHQLPAFVQLHEYDPAYYVNYLSRPMKGLIVGGIVFLLMFAGSGVFGDLGTLGSGGLRSPLIYLAATAAGYKQENLMQLVDVLLRTSLLKR